MALVLAQSEELPTNVEFPRNVPVSSWVYLGEGAAARIALEQSTLAQLERIPTADRLQRLAFELRRPYIDAIGRLSLRNDSLEWWASELAAKNPYTHLFGRLCALATVRALVEDGLDDCLVVCGTAALLAEVEAAAAASGRMTTHLGTAAARAHLPGPTAIARQLVEGWAGWAPKPMLRASSHLPLRVRSVLERSARFRRTTLAALDVDTTEPFAGPGTALLFTWSDRRSIAEDGTYVDPHYGWLPGALRARGYDVAFLPRFVGAFDFGELAARLTATGERFVFPDLLVDRAAERICVKRAEAFAPDIPGDLAAAGVPLARLAREHVEEYRTAHAQSLSYEPLVDALAASGVAPELIIHTYEGHAWEQVLAAAVRRHLPGTRVVGYDNLNMTRLALSLYPARVELGKRPLPDRIVTNGLAFRDVLIAEGVPDRLVAVGCGIRHAGLFDTGGEERGERDGAHMIVLVATDAALDRAAELVDKATRAFGGDRGYDVLVKCHPLIDPANVRALVGGAPPRNVAYVAWPIGELMRGVDVMLYSYSAVCWEALAYGVPPLFVRAETDLDLDQLEQFAELRWSARTPDELREAARAIAALGVAERGSWRRRAHDAVRAAVVPVHPGCVEAFVA